jgi:hypothetical protein
VQLFNSIFMQFPNKLLFFSVLPCQTCKKPCNSYMGYLSHFTFCEISVEEHALRMYQCLLCDKRMFPSSRYYHDSNHSKLEQEIVQPPEFVDVGASRKRAAAVKARSSIKDYDAEESKEETVPFRIVEKENKKVLIFFCLSKPLLNIPTFLLKGIVGKRKGWRKALSVGGPLCCRYIGCEFKSTELEVYEDHITASCPLMSEVGLAEIFVCMLLVEFSKLKPLLLSPITSGCGC